MTNTNAFMASKPIQAGMTLPPTLPLSLPPTLPLEWEGYRALCARMQQPGSSDSSAAERSKKGPNAAAMDP